MENLIETRHLFFAFRQSGAFVIFGLSYAPNTILFNNRHVPSVVLNLFSKKVRF